MSVGILRVLVQSQIVDAAQVERYQSVLKSNKSILPLLFEEGVITPKALGELLARVFSYPLLDLRYYPRSNILSDVLSEEQMLQ
ncbi:type IV-A pilus assembly ATPase PilB, partial [Neisseria musculi]